MRKKTLAALLFIVTGLASCSGEPKPVQLPALHQATYTLIRTWMRTDTG